MATSPNGLFLPQEELKMGFHAAKSICLRFSDSLASALSHAVLRSKRGKKNHERWPSEFCLCSALRVQSEADAFAGTADYFRSSEWRSFLDIAQYFHHPTLSDSGRPFFHPYFQFSWPYFFSKPVNHINKSMWRKWLFLSDAKYVHWRFSLMSVFLYILGRSQIAHRASDVEDAWKRKKGGKR